MVLSKEVADRLYRTLPDSRIVIFITNQEDAIASQHTRRKKCTIYSRTICTYKSFTSRGIKLTFRNI
ncbi:MAG: hypothetical protein QNJ54_30100 [Prochloraceae cyanobacterium]|nr:hypothetical protein [Prochloraceae cyanobacterium]